MRYSYEMRELEMKQTLCPIPQDASIWAYTNMCQSDWVVLDTETTGRPGEIIDLAILNHEGKVIFDSLLKPRMSIPLEVTKIHGITNNDVQNVPLFADVWPSIQELLLGKRIITYNAEFDRNSFIFTSHRQHIELHDMVWECLMKAYAQYRNEPNQYGSPKWHKLHEACHQQGLEIVQLHRALGDAWAAYELMKRLAITNEAFSYPISR